MTFPDMNVKKFQITGLKTLISNSLRFPHSLFDGKTETGEKSTDLQITFTHSENETRVSSLPESWWISESPPSVINRA